MMFGDRYFALGATLLMANDMPNATAAFAVAMKGHEAVAKKHAAEAEAATRFGKEDPKGEAAHVADGSVPAGQAAEDLEENAGDPSDAQEGTHALHIPLL